MCFNHAELNLTKGKKMVTRTDMIEVIAIFCLMLVVSITLLTNFRTCEFLENGQVIKASCIEAMNHEK